MTNRLDDLQRYLDILFADYRDAEPARRLRARMEGQMLREKDKLRSAGMTEKEAVSYVLNHMGQQGIHGEGTLLIYADRFARDSAGSLLGWSLTGLIFSAPLVVLGRLFFPILLLLISLFAAAWAWHYTDQRVVEDVAFFSIDSTQKLSTRLWIVFGVLLLVFTVAAILKGKVEGQLPVVASAQRLADFYRPWLLIVFPLWGRGLRRLLLKNEVKHSR